MHWRMVSQLRPRRNAPFSARFLSDPKSLMPEVCPFIGTPALQFSSWINENNNLFNLISYNTFISSS